MGPNLKLPRVLVGEDDATILDVVGDLLESEGYEVLRASSLTEVRTLLGEHPDVVVLDLHLEDGSSEELLAEMAPRLSAPPTVLMSASTTAPRVARRYGVALLIKPFDLDRFLRVIHQAIGEHASA